MPYLLLILFPLAIAASCFVLRKQTQLVILIALATVCTLAALVVQIPLDAPARMLGVTLIVNALSRLFLLTFLMVMAVAFGASWHLPHGEQFVPVSLLVLALLCAILMLQDPFLIALLLVGASLATVLAVVDLPTGAGVLVGTHVIATALKYLVLMVTAGMLMYLSFVLADVYQLGELPGRIPLSRFVLSLMAVGFALRLAVIPFHAWLPDLVEDVSPMVATLVAALVNVTSLIVLLVSLQRFPSLISENPWGWEVLRWLGLATAVLGGLLALVQTNMRRTLAYLLIYDTGTMLFGVASISAIGLTGALLGAVNQSVAATLLFISLGLLERPDGRTPGVERHDLLRRWPVGGLGLLGGGLTLIGLPPFSGFAGKLLLYQAAAQRGWVSLFPLLLGLVLATLALLRLARTWLLGPSDDTPVAEPLMLGETELDRPAPRRLPPEPRSTALITTALLTLCLILGLYPQPLLALITIVVRGLTFVQAL